MSSKTAAPAPSPGPSPGASSTSGYFGGGYQPFPTATVSNIERMIFSTDTATAVSTGGKLSSARSGLAASGTSTDGWHAGGRTNPGAEQSTIDRIIFSSDSSNAIAKGPLSATRYSSAGSGNVTDAWFSGGVVSASTVSSTDRMIFSSDTATAVAKGPLSSARYYLASSGNSTDTWVSGGSPGGFSTVDRIIFSTDTAAAVTKGKLSIGRGRLTSFSNDSTSAWCAGGLDVDITRSSRTDRIIFATDTATAVAKGRLVIGTIDPGSVSNSTDGWVSGGLTPSPASLVSTIQRMIFASDTANLVAKGPMSVAKRYSPGAP